MSKKILWKLYLCFKIESIGDLWHSLSSIQYQQIENTSAVICIACHEPRIEFSCKLIT